jgi:hypothetical protein
LIKIWTVSVVDNFFGFETKAAIKTFRILAGADPHVGETLALHAPAANAPP